MTHDPNVLLIILDSIRAKNTSLHVDGLETTPFLESFASEATVYEQARAPSSWSLPSHVSIFTGEYPHSHGVTNTNERLPEGHTVFETLESEGYATGVVTENPFLIRDDNGLCVFEETVAVNQMRFPSALDPEDFVLDAGVGSYFGYLEACIRHPQPLKSILNGIDHKLRYDASWIPGVSDTTLAPGSDLAAALLEWIDTKNGPWAACVNLMDAHAPYEPTTLYESTPQLAQLRSQIDSYNWDFYAGDQPWWLLKTMEPLYNDAIRDADKGVSNIIEGLRDRGQLDDTLVVITSDHGEAFGEFSETGPPMRVAGHGRFAIEELLHVPLVVKYPDQQAGEMRSDVVSLTDFPTVVAETRSNGRGYFGSDNPVLASEHWEDTHLLPEKYENAIPLKDLKTPTRVMYESNKTAIQKTIERGEDRAVWHIATEGAKWRRDDLETGAIEETFVATKSDRIASQRRDEYDEATLDRLKDLGYA